MEFNFLAGLVAGFVGVIAMTVMMKMAGAMGMTNMPPMPLIQGAMFTDDRDTAQKIGMVTHVLVMGTLVFGTVYAALFAGFSTASWLAGVVIGAVHGIVAGVAFAMMGAMHPRMVTGTRGAAVDVQGGQLRIVAPGPFGINYGGGTPMGIVLAHVVYGLVVALVYGAIV